MIHFSKVSSSSTVSTVAGPRRAGRPVSRFRNVVRGTLKFLAAVPNFTPDDTAATAACIRFSVSFGFGSIS